jgi:16S rRNA C967 or C1407 C5-methylase (RsmB/RsmF family)
MNDIAKQATADKFLLALKKEHLSKKEAGDFIDIAPAQVSYLFNKHYWERLGNTGWERVLAWVNSGQSLTEYARKHGKTLDAGHVSVTKEAVSVTEKAEIVPEVVKSEQKSLIKIKHGVLEKRKEEIAVKERRASRGEMVDMLISEKESLRAKIDAIDVLLKHYIS